MERSEKLPFPPPFSDFLELFSFSFGNSFFFSSSKFHPMGKKEWSPHYLHLAAMMQSVAPSLAESVVAFASVRSLLALGAN